MWKRTQKSGRALTISLRATPPSLAVYGRSWWTKMMIMIMRSWSQNESMAFTVCVSSLMIIMMWGSNWEAVAQQKRRWFLDEQTNGVKIDNCRDPAHLSLNSFIPTLRCTMYVCKKHQGQNEHCVRSVFSEGCTVKSFSEAENLKRRELRAEELSHTKKIFLGAKTFRDVNCQRAS